MQNRGLSFLLVIGVGVFTISCGPSVKEMNERIDKLEVDSDEILIRANSMSELEIVVEAMEKRQGQRIKDITEREQKAKLRIAQIEADINNRIAKMQEMHRAAENYEKARKGEMKTLNQRYDNVMNKLKDKVDLDQEREVELLERLLTRIEELEAENKKLMKKMK